MNGILKEKVSILKDQMSENIHELAMVEQKVASQKKYLRDLSSITAQQKKEKLDTIKSLQEDIRVLNEKNNELTKDITEKSPDVNENMTKISEQITSLDKYMMQFSTQQKDVVKQAKFFEDNDICPTCSQDIDETTKNYHLDKCKTKAGTIKNALDMGDLQRKEFSEKQESIQVQLDCIREWQSSVNANNQEISTINRSIDRLNSELDTIDNETGDLSEANDELENLRVEKEQLQKKKYELSEQNSYYRKTLVSRQRLSNSIYQSSTNLLTSIYKFLTSLFTSIWTKPLKRLFGHDIVTHSPTTHLVKGRNNVSTYHYSLLGDRLPR